MQVQGRKAAIISGSALVLALAVGGIAISQTGGNTTPVAGSSSTATAVSTSSSAPSSSASVAPSTVTSVQTVVETVVAQTVQTDKASGSVLSHFGLGEIKLGTSIAQLKAAGLLAANDDGPWTDVCTLRELRQGQVKLGITPDRGIEVIQIDQGISTTEGIHKGSTMAEVRAAYPNVVDEVNGHRVDLADHPGASYYITEWMGTGEVSMIALQTKPQRCYN